MSAMAADPTSTTPAGWSASPRRSMSTWRAASAPLQARPLSAFAEYRPRLLTRFAVDALTNAAAGKPLPPPPPLGPAAAQCRHLRRPLFGRERRNRGAAGSPLTIVANGQSAPLQPWGDDLFRTTHPAFRAVFSLLFERSRERDHRRELGSAELRAAGSARDAEPSNPALARLAGRYVNDSPWVGMAHRRRARRQAVDRHRDADGSGSATISGASAKKAGRPSARRFANFIDGRPQTFIFSGEKFLRHDI